MLIMCVHVCVCSGSGSEDDDGDGEENEEEESSSPSDGDEDGESVSDTEGSEQSGGWSIHTPAQAILKKMRREKYESLCLFPFHSVLFVLCFSQFCILQDSLTGNTRVNDKTDFCSVIKKWM